MSKTIKHKMITLAREARGLTLVELANETKINRVILSKVEMGLYDLDETQIDTLAKVLDFPVSFFTLETQPIKLSDFFYRKRATMKVKEKTLVDAEIEIIKIIYDRLVASVEIPDARIITVMTKAGVTPEDVAIMAREFFKVERGPVKNLINYLEKNGIAVVLIDSDSEKFDGATIYTDKGSPIIVINKNMPNDRKRFTIAHELGHQIMHLPFRFENELYDRIEKDDDDVFEKEADRFASEFLMPTSDIVSDLHNLTYRKLGMLKLYWNVSKRALVYKAKTIGCVTDKKYTSLMIELSRYGERTHEKIDVDIDEPKILKQLFDIHTNHFQYSAGELSDILSISERDILKLQTVHNIKKMRIVL